MKLKLPDGEKIELSRDNDIKKRMEFVNNILLKFEEFIIDNYDTKQVNYFLEGCANYLVWCKEDGTMRVHDGTILQRKKTLKMENYDKDEIPFSTLSQADSYKYGLEETEEIL